MYIRTQRALAVGVSDKPIKYYTEDFRLREAEAETERKEKLA